MIDNPRDLTWRGRSNLYAEIGVFLAFSTRVSDQEPIVDFARWMETPTELRETGTTVATASVWDAADPSQALRDRDRQPDARLPAESDDRRQESTPGRSRARSGRSSRT